MALKPQDFIELNRTFFELSEDYTDVGNDDLEFSEALGLRVNNDLSWDDLLKKHRVVLLSQAGSGKTKEIQHTAIKLRLENKIAFLLRLENIPDDLEDSFEEGDFTEFEAWLSSNEEGWLFLDSVDEARLRDPCDFKNAIKTIAKYLKPALERTHIIITGRSNAWRAKTDLDLCKKHLPYKPSDKKEEQGIDDDEIFQEGKNVDTNKVKSEITSGDSIFEFYALANLSDKQIKAFLAGKEADDPKRFLDDIERHDARAYISRPQDLEELIEFWTAKKKIGSRLELIEYSIKRRLNERDQDRDDSKPIVYQKAYDGIKLIAAAATLTKQSNIRIPDGSNNNVGLDIKSILTDWDNEQFITLLGRPIFDEGPYGSVRFHHRSVREFLTAKWLVDLLKRHASRPRIESLFLQEQYGIQVVVPTMRAILSWLVLFDGKIREKVCKIEPEIIFEGGDPSKLPMNTRRDVLRIVCKKMASKTSRRSVDDYSSVQRFANTDIAKDIKSLIEEYKENTEITNFLMRMIWHGRIKEALPEAKSFALNANTEKYTRIAAIRALKEIGSAQDFQEVLESFLLQKSKIDRRVFAETVDRLDASKGSVVWIFKTLEKAADKKKFSVSGLSYSLVKFAERLEPDIALNFTKHIDGFLKREPVIERRFCEISKQFGWLINCGARAVEKLITSRHPAALSPESLSILSKIPPFKEYADFENRSLTTEISELAKDWTDLKFALFWKDVEVTRKNAFFNKGERLTNFWQAYTLRPYWNFEESDFKRVKEEITKKDFLDDKLVALSLAFQIYKENERPRKWREQLKKLVEGKKELEKRLAELLNPPAQSKDQRRWKQQDAKWKRQDKKRKEERQKHHADWLKWLNENFETLRDIDLLNETLGKGCVLNAQQYLLDRMRKTKDNSTHWTQGNWRDLSEGFGKEIAEAFRDSLLLSWKFYKPKLRSETDDEGGTPLAVIIGLSGLEIESRETVRWPDGLSKEDVKLACRYAFQELNGFPNWFPKLYKRFPKIVSECVLKEIDWELTTGQDGQEKHYVIDKISWSGQTLWDDLAPELLKRLGAEPLSLKYLGGLLKVIQSSSTVPDEDIAQLASKKCKTLNGLNHIAIWFAAWAGVEADSAIEDLSQYLEAMSNSSEGVNLAMNVIVNLVGERRTGSHARESFKSQKHLKNLYLLMHKYIKVEEDINRAGGGVYSPDLRDNAQDARNGIFSILKDIPGKETYLALVELSETHPAESFRSRIMHNAKERAEMDADMPAWSDDKFIEYSQSLESTPTNHRELFDLVKQRIFDLKHDLEESDTSNAQILIDVKETKIRNYIGGWCRDRANGMYSIQQEEELADAKRPDLRFQGSGFDAPVPVELKIADNWSVSELLEGLENQLCCDYLRDNRSNKGIFLLVYRGKTFWKIPDGNQKVDFHELLETLKKRWEKISKNYPNIDQVEVIGIDLTKRLAASQGKPLAS